MMPAFDRTEDVEDFLHRFVALEEDRFLFTSALDTGGHGCERACPQRVKSGSHGSS
jgi:hypothetical protein